MKVKVSKNKKDLINHNIKYMFSSWKFYIGIALSLLGIYILENDFASGSIVFFAGFILFYMYIYKIISLKKALDKIVDLEYELYDDSIHVITNNAEIKVSFKDICKISENKFFLRIKPNKDHKPAYRNIHLYKFNDFDSDINEFIKEAKNKYSLYVNNKNTSESNIEQASSNTEYNAEAQEANSSKEFILSFKSNFKNDLLRICKRYYRRFLFLAVFLLTTVVSLVLLQSGETLEPAVLLIIISILLLLSPIINTVIHKNKISVKIDVYEESDEIVMYMHDSFFNFNKKDFKIYKTNRGEVILEHTSNKNLRFGIMKNEILRGDTEKLFNILEEGQAINTSRLGEIAIILSMTSIIAVPLLPVIEQLGYSQTAVFGILGCVLVSFILSLINLFKKNVTKRLASVALILDLLMIILFINII